MNYAIGVPGSYIRIIINTSDETRAQAQCNAGEVYLEITQAPQDLVGGVISADGKTVTVPPTPLADLQDLKWSDTKSIRDVQEVGGCSTSIGAIRTDQKSQSTLAAYATSAISAKMNNTTFSVNWILANNQIATLDADGIIGLMNEVNAFLDATYDYSQKLRTQIYATTTSAALDAIDTNAGWPTKGV